MTPETMMGPEAIQRYRELVELIPDEGLFLELGSFHGGSLVALEEVIKRKKLSFVACDMWDLAPNPAPGILTEEMWAKKREGMLKTFWENIIQHGLEDYVYKIVDRKTQSLTEVFPTDAFDLIFIDAGHTYKAVKADIEEVKPLLTKNGILCGHDYCPDFPGVMRAVDEAFGPRPVDVATSIWVVE